MMEQLGASKVTRRGQITLNRAVRESLGVVEGDYVMFVKQGKRVYVIAADLVPR